MQSTERNLGALLEDESFLWRVLSFLDEESAADCRCVCRRWRHVSYQLPLRIKLYPVAESLSVARRFSNTQALLLTAWKGMHWATTDFPMVQSAFEMIHSFKNLKRFESDCRLRGSDWIESLRKLHNLEALCLQQSAIMGGNPTALANDLSRLTELSMSLSPSRPKEEPLMEGCHLKKLNMHLADIVCQDGRLRFQRSTQLISLSVFFNQSLTEPCQFKKLEVYSDTVKELTLENLDSCPSSRPFDQSLLKSFRKMQSLVISSVTITGRHFYESILELHSLETLALVDLYFLQEQTASFEQLSALQHLQSLKLSPMWRIDKEGDCHSIDQFDCSGFQNLTRLDFSEGQTSVLFPHSGKLRDLQFANCVNGDDKYLSPLAHHLDLDRLSMDVTHSIRGSWLALFSKLTHLSLKCVYEAQDLTSAIGAMVQLEYLDISLTFSFSTHKLTDNIATALSGLPSLRTLKINATWHDIRRYLSAPLKYLQIKKGPEKKLSLNSFRQRIPSLKKVTYSNVTVNYY